jgi:hypothetical protein
MEKEPAHRIALVRVNILGNGDEPHAERNEFLSHLLVIQLQLFGFGARAPALSLQRHPGIHI